MALRLLNVLDSSKATEYLRASCRAAFSRYHALIITYSKHGKAIFLFASVDTKTLGAKRFDITSLYCSHVYNFVTEVFLDIVYTAQKFFKHHHKPSLFHKTPFSAMLYFSLKCFTIVNYSRAAIFSLSKDKFNVA